MGNKKYIKLVCPNGKTPHVDSSVYGWWKKKGHRCYRTKGECTIDAKVPEYPCKGHNRCTITIAKSYQSKPCTVYKKFLLVTWSNLDMHDYEEIKYDCVPDVDFSTLSDAVVHYNGGKKYYSKGGTEKREEDEEVEEKEEDEEVEEKEEDEEVEKKEEDEEGANDEEDKGSFLAEVRETLEGLAEAEVDNDKRETSRSRKG